MPPALRIDHPWSIRSLPGVPGGRSAGRSLTPVAANPIDVALLVAQVLQDCEVRYLVGGSIASSVSGEPRSTLDVDLVVELRQTQIKPLLEALGDTFYADEESIRRAVKAKSSANIIPQQPTAARCHPNISGPGGARRRPLRGAFRPDEEGRGLGRRRHPFGLTAWPQIPPRMEGRVFGWHLGSRRLLVLGLRPSHASMFAGLYPRSHGAIHVKLEHGVDAPLADKFETLAEVLSDERVPSFAVVANTFFLPRVFGLDQGFQLYDVRGLTACLPGWARHSLRRVVSRGLGLFGSKAWLRETHRDSVGVTRDVFSILDAVARPKLPSFSL